MSIENQINGVPEWESKIDLIRRTVAAGASADEMELFLHQARRSGLDPLAKQIYFVKRQGKGVVQVGIDGLRLIADRTDAYAGSDDSDFGPTNDRGYPSFAKVTVYKMVQGQRCPFSATARWDEYFPGDAQGFQWKRMPHAMLHKCAEALALRKAFPADMGGLYVHEEMEQAGTSENAVQEPQRPKATTATSSPAALAEGTPGNANAADPPVNPDAFGYRPMRWPVAKMFSEPATESQTKMTRAKARERMLDIDELDVVRRLVLEAFGLEDDGSKAALSLFIDWLMNGTDETLDLATAAAEAEPRSELELS